MFGYWYTDSFFLSLHLYEYRKRNTENRELFLFNNNKNNRVSFPLRLCCWFCFFLFSCSFLFLFFFPTLNFSRFNICCCGLCVLLCHCAHTYNRSIWMVVVANEHIQYHTYNVQRIQINYNVLCMLALVTSHGCHFGKYAAVVVFGVAIIRFGQMYWTKRACFRLLDF